MPEVTLKINGRGYSLSCDEGQEQRLVDLSHYVDGRLKDISAAGAATNESHLLVLTALVMADEVYELRDEVKGLKDHLHHLQSNPVASTDAASAEHDAQVAYAIEHLAAKIEQIADRVSREDGGSVAAA